jgi:NinB protein
MQRPSTNNSAASSLPLPDARLYERCPRCGRKQTRTTLQNARLWVIYNRIAERAVDRDGRVFESDVWHEYFKQLYLGKVDIELPDGRIVTRSISTRTLDVAEFGDYMTAVEVWAGERGIYLDE